MKKNIIIIILVGMAFPLFLYGQEQTSTAQKVEEMKLKLNEDGSHYLKWTFLNQVWLRYNESNPGTTVLDENANSTFDIGLRRTRIQFFAQATVDQTDEFSRKLSVYARGQLGKFDYRIVLSDPFPITSNGLPAASTPGPSATFSPRGQHKQYQGFFQYNFFDKETHTTPYMTGTYLGRKKIFNIEAGFITQKNAMWLSRDGVSTSFQNMTLWSVALFYDAPVNVDKGTAFSAYAGYFDLDYGTDYLRYNGIMNPANGINNGPFSGSQGNAFPMFGTGDVIYSQVGYLFKQDLLGSAGTLMPYASLMS